MLRKISRRKRSRLIFILLFTLTIWLLLLLARQASKSHKQYALAVKTRKGVATNQLTIQIQTFLNPIKNVVLIGDIDYVLDNQNVTIKHNVTDENEGWNEDSNNNLQSYRLLYQTYPDVEWYIMIDDDTYLFMANLDYFLNSYDSSLPYYFGYANNFVTIN
jgi:hypothetical protein